MSCQLPIYFFFVLTVLTAEFACRCVILPPFVDTGLSTNCPVAALRPKFGTAPRLEGFSFDDEESDVMKGLCSRLSKCSRELYQKD
jgi:hypothetical protein